MIGYTLRRAGMTLLVLLAVSVLVFLMSHLTPGDPATIMLGENASRADVLRLRHELGLDRPLPVQYGRYLLNVLRGDLGRSIRSGRPVAGGSGWRALVLPAVTLAAQAAAVLARLTRASLLEVLPSDYVRTARAKGVASRRVLFHHALRNALIPVVTVIGLQFGGLLGGAV